VPTEPETVIAAACAVCGGPLPIQTGVGRRRLYCGDECAEVHHLLSLLDRKLEALAKRMQGDPMAARYASRITSTLWSMLNTFGNAFGRRRRKNPGWFAPRPRMSLDETQEARPVVEAAARREALNQSRPQE